MPAYRIEIAYTGAELVTLVADSEQDALDTMSRDAGYADFADAVSAGDFEEVDLRVTQLHYAVRAEVPADCNSSDASSLYRDCPEGFVTREEATEWADRLSSQGAWGSTHPRYRVAQIEG